MFPGDQEMLDLSVHERLAGGEDERRGTGLVAGLCCEIGPDSLGLRSPPLYQ